MLQCIYCMMSFNVPGQPDPERLQYVQHMRSEHSSAILIAIMKSDPMVWFEWGCNLCDLRMNGPETRIFQSPQPQIDSARNEAVEFAINAEIPYIFFLDTDILLPKDTLYRLLRHKKDVVSVLYARRHQPTFNEMLIEVKDQLGHDTLIPVGEGEYPKESLVSCDCVGSGGLLIRTEILRGIERPFFIWTVGSGGAISGRCVLPNQNVLGGSLIQEVKGGEKIFTSEGRLGRVGSPFNKHYVGDICRIQCKIMRLPALTTPEHYILVKKTRDSLAEWIQAKDLQMGYFGCFPIPRQVRPNGKFYPRYRKTFGIQSAEFKRFHDSENHMYWLRLKRCHSFIPAHYKLTEAFGELLGWYLAEGWSSTKKGGSKVLFTVGYERYEKVYAERIKRKMKEVFGLSCWIRPCDHALEVGVKNRTLAYLFKKWFGTNAHNKKIPNWMYDTNLNFTKGFIRGFWRGDGYQTYAGTTKVPILGTNIASKELALGIVSMLLKLGIRPQLREYYQHKTSFSGGKSKVYVVKVQGDCHKLLDVLRESRRKRKPLKNISLIPRGNNKKNLSFISEGKYWFPIESISTEHYDGIVHDLQNISPDNSFVLENLIMHNSEDFDFCRKIRRHGIPIFVDTSIVAGHINYFKVKPNKNPASLNLDFPSVGLF